MDLASYREGYDDGFVAYLNGKRVLGVNAPEAVKYNSRATKQNTRIQFQDFEMIRTYKK